MVSLPFLNRKFSSSSVAGGRGGGGGGVRGDSKTTTPVDTEDRKFRLKKIPGNEQFYNTLMKGSQKDLNKYAGSLTDEDITELYSSTMFQDDLKKMQPKVRARILIFLNQRSKLNKILNKEEKDKKDKFTNTNTNTITINPNINNNNINTNNDINTNNINNNNINTNDESETKKFQFKDMLDSEVLSGPFPSHGRDQEEEEEGESTDPEFYRLLKDLRKIKTSYSQTNNANPTSVSRDYVMGQIPSPLPPRPASGDGPYSTSPDPSPSFHEASDVTNMEDILSPIVHETVTDSIHDTSGEKTGERRDVVKALLEDEDPLLKKMNELTTKSRGLSKDSRKRSLREVAS